MNRMAKLINLVVIGLMLFSAVSCGRQPTSPTPQQISSPTAVPAASPTSQPTSTIQPTPTRQPSPTPINPLTKQAMADQSPLAPQVIDQNTELGPSSPLEVKFDQSMDKAATSAAWSLIGPDGQPVSGQPDWVDPTTFHFTPAKPLQRGAIYLASFNTSAKSAGGAALRETVKLKFEVSGDLQISQVFPAPGTAGVDNKAVITVLFTRPVVPLVAAEQQGSLPNPLSLTPAVTGKGEWVNTSVFTFHPDKPLQTGITYQAAIKGGLAAADSESAPLAQDYTWQFTTQAPTIEFIQMGKITNPNPGLPNVPLDAKFVIGFHQAMNPGSVEAALKLSAGANGVALDLTWDKENKTLSISPSQRLQYGTRYTLALGTAAQAAEGGGLDKPLDWSFTTVRTPAISSTTPGAKDDRSFTIRFASPMALKTLVDRVVFNPPVKTTTPDGANRWYYNDSNFSLVFYGLEPSTAYQVTLQAGMADLYGKTIDQTQTVRFTTAPISPWANLMMPWGAAMYRVDGPQEFYTQYVNVRSVSFKLYRLSKETLISILNNSGYPTEADYPKDPPVWQVTEANKGKLDEIVLKKVSLSGENGAPLAAGVYLLAMDSPSITHQGPYIDLRLVVVASASITLKNSPGEALLWMTDLKGGQPVAGVPISAHVVTYTGKGAISHESVQGATDSNGLLRLVLPGGDKTAAYAMSEDDQHFALAVASWGSGVSPYQFGISEAYYGPNITEKAYLYTDRPIYRPGQPVYYKGMARHDNDLDYTIPDQNKVEVTIASFKEKVYQEVLDLSPYGTFDGKFVLDQGAALGAYTITARFLNSQQAAGMLSFNVAEYRKPEYLVTVTAGPENLLLGEKFTAKVQADYFSGGAVSGAAVNWSLRALPFTFTPPDNLSGYSFVDLPIDSGEVFFFPNQPDSVLVAEGVGKTDDQGAFGLSLPAELTKTGSSQSGPQSQVFTFEATLVDLSGNEVSGRANVTAHQSEVYVGVKPADYVGIAGEEQKFELVAVDWQGAPRPDQKVDVDIVERRWYSVQEQDQQGNLRWTTSVKEIPVTSFKDQAAGADGKFTVSFTPPAGGVYAARATALDSHGNQAKASAYLWVAGQDYIPWRQSNDRSFQLVADQTSYKPGDTARLLVASPFQGEAYALVTIERGHTRQAEVLKLTSNSTVYDLPITPDMAPNVFVAVTIVKGIDDTNPRPNFKIGMVKLKVATDEQALNVTVKPDRQQAGPGEKVSYQVKVTDLAGKPVKAEVSLGLSDLATLSLAAPNSQPLLSYFYSPRDLQVSTAVSIIASAEEYNANVKPTTAQGLGGGSGGGKGGGLYLGVMEVRQDFPDTAYWEAHLVTGEDGQATATVTLPDNLTTWRMDARAITLDTRVGQATVDMISTKSLLVRPQTPRFFVAGDQSSLGTAVHNNTDQDLAVNVSLDAQGIDLQGAKTQQVQIPAHQQAYVTWQGTVKGDAERVDLVFSAVSGSFKDASRPTAGTLSGQGLPVYQYEARETIGTSGILKTGGATAESISTSPDLNVKQGTLTLELAPSLAASMTDGLDYLETYPYDCTEQTVSSFLPNILTTAALKAAGLSNPDLEANLKEQVSKALQRLASRQNSDGGWGWWGSQTSELLTSAYVVQGLVEAMDAGYTVNQDVLNRGLDYLTNNLQPMESLSPRQGLNRQAFVLYVLARAGRIQPSFSGQLFDARQSLSLYARGYLAQTLFRIDPKDTRLPTLLSDLNNAAILSATGAHWEETVPDVWNWNTDVRSTAIILDTLQIINPSSDLNANAVRWLMSNRKGGFWRTTQETAWVLMALTEWIKTSGELKASYDYGAAFNGQPLGSGTANAETIRQVQTLRLNVSSVLAGEANRLVIARSDGPGSLYYTARLDLALPVEKVQSLDRGFVISRQYFKADDLNAPVTSANQGDLLLVRLTVVASAERHYVSIDDPLPAGLEVVDTSLNTSPQALQPQEYDWNRFSTEGYGWWYFNHVELRDSKVILAADYLPKGTYVYTYYARASTPGVFKTIPPEAQEFYFPEVFGRGDGSIFEVKAP